MKKTTDSRLTIENESSTQQHLPILENRREFLSRCFGMLAGISVVGVATPLLQGCEPTTAPPASGGDTGGNNTGGTTFDVSGLTADGESLVTSTKGPDGKHILLVRTAAAEYLALSMECTHQQCEVASPVGGVLVCPCHGSEFNVQGAVLQGPASSPLKRYPTTYDPSTGRLTVTLQ
jgi:Rieske Fe-S protein